jgi:phosphoglycerol transferase MdoB-like AlkP superfamily enzyme
MSKESSSSGVSFMGLLTILFIALKLTNFIDWSWWWVLSPMWLSAVILVLAVILLIFIRKAKEKL